jgi:acetoin:2,6-dichlorophenolindophenol oxidoreductase subunit alpha
MTQAPSTKQSVGPGLDDVDALRRMMLIRRFEEAVWELYRRGKMPGLAHLSIGHEAVAVGTCGVLNRDDYILSTHRGHGHCIGKGAVPSRMMAEMLGKATGYCGGRGGTMHIADMENSNLGAVAIVGAGFGLATGVALACKRHGHGQIVVAFIGEGAMNQGVTHEAMNLASIWKLPVVFVCENNVYSEYTRSARMTSGLLTARAEAHEIPASQVDGMDYRKVRSATEEAAERARRGDGPSFIEYLTYRLGGHHVGDQERYRPRTEVDEWRQRDPIDAFSRVLLAEGRIAPDDIDALSADVQREIAEAIHFAVESPFPEASEVEDFVYA